MKKIIFVAVTVLSMALTVGQAQAALLDLTTAGSSGFIGSGYFEQLDLGSTGSGVIDPFVRLSTNDNVSEGYNTSGRPLQFDENSSPTFTRDLLYSEIPIINLDPDGNNVFTAYRQFLLDINEGGGPNRFVSLDDIKIFTSNTGGLNPSNIFDLGTLVYDFDAGADNKILLDASLNSGGGYGDMFAYIPNSVFDGKTYIYLYSKFGLDPAQDGGFEEWAVMEASTEPPAPTPVPEPATMMLMASGLAGLGLRRRNKK